MITRFLDFNSNKLIAILPHLSWIPEVGEQIEIADSPEENSIYTIKSRTLKIFYAEEIKHYEAIIWVTK